MNGHLLKHQDASSSSVHHPVKLAILLPKDVLFEYRFCLDVYQVTVDPLAVAATYFLREEHIGMLA